MRRGRAFPEAWTSISYEDYRSIWFDTRNALWEGEAGHAAAAWMSLRRAFISRARSISRSSKAANPGPVEFDLGVFDKTDKFPDLPIDDTLDYSGLRLQGRAGDTPGIFHRIPDLSGGKLFPGHRHGRYLWPLSAGAGDRHRGSQGRGIPGFRSLLAGKTGAGDVGFRDPRAAGQPQRRRGLPVHGHTGTAAW